MLVFQWQTGDCRKGFEMTATPCTWYIRAGRLIASVCIALVLCPNLLNAESGSESKTADAAASRRPNIVWIWADNLAYADLSCFGSPSIRTPVIDQLAVDGVKLTQYYVAHVVCSPSRAALLTGRQPFRVGIVDVLRPDGPSGIPADEITLAEALSDLGYATIAIGKWHLGDRPQFLPTRHGFGGYLGLPYSMDMLPTILYRDEEIVEELSGDKVADITERYTDEAIRFVRTNRDRPFFLYLSHTIPHPPLNIPDAEEDEDRPVYDAAIEYLDRQTGLLLDELERLNLAEDTLVVFTSDNGPMSRGGNTGELRGRIGESFEGGIRVPFVARWPGRIPPGQVVATPAIAYDAFPTLLALAGGSLSEDRIYDGQDIRPLLMGEGKFVRRQPFFWVNGDTVTAIRDGRWKLQVAHRTKKLPSAELYDIARDPGESRNLAVDRPDLVARLGKQVAEFQQQVPKVWSLRYPVRDPAKLNSGVRRE